MAGDATEAMTFLDPHAGGLSMQLPTLGVLALSLVAAAAAAQPAATNSVGAGTARPTPTMQPSRANPAAATNDSNQAVATTAANAPAPARGANSFTEGEARRRLETNGYTNVSGLTKDDDGVWRGTAQKGSQEARVWLDFKGNVGQQ